MATYKFVGEQFHYFYNILVVVDFKTKTITERSVDPETTRDFQIFHENTQQMRHKFDAWISGQRKADPGKTLFQTFRDNFMANYVNCRPRDTYQRPVESKYNPDWGWIMMQVDKEMGT